MTAVSEDRSHAGQVAAEVAAGQGARRPPIVGVFGGSFDPPHLGHALVPAYLFARGLVDRVVVAPVADHPFGKTMRPFADRLLLTRVALSGAAGAFGPGVSVTDLEATLAAEHGGPSTTLRLLEAVAAEHPDAQVRLVIGSDIIADGQTDRWHRWDTIERRFPPIVVPRSGFANDGAVPCALPAISSSEVRAWWTAWHDHGRDADRNALAAAVPPQVLRLLDCWAQPSREQVWLIGQGHVAAHATPWLRMQGIDVIPIAGRALVDGSQPVDAPWPDAVWVLARDTAIAGVAAALVDAGLPDHIPVLHGAGAMQSVHPNALGPLHEAGNPVGTLHPICSLRQERPWPSALPDAGFGFEGDPAARAVALRWIGEQPRLDLQGLDTEARRAYHAACALAANHLAVLQQEAAGVLTAQGHDGSAVGHALGVLLRSALDNLAALGVPAGITGPVSRGDMATVARHVAALPGTTADLYATLSQRLAAIVQRTQDVSS